jgi:glycosyltransferase involved in cell wall biosynthesis
VTGSLPPMKCGVGDYSYGLAVALAAEGADVGVLTDIRAKDAVATKNLEVLPIVSHWSLRGLPMLASAMHRFSPDIVHIQYPTQGYGRNGAPALIPVIAFMMGAAVFQTWHEIFQYRTVLGLVHNLVGFASKALVPGTIVVVRPGYRASLGKFFQSVVRRKRIEFIPNAAAIPKSDLGFQELQALRGRHLNGQKRLIVFFGFLLPAKRVELLFQIADPETDRIVIAGAFDEQDEYYLHIRELASSPLWKEKVTFTGFLGMKDAADLLSVSDAVVLPFLAGGGEWNTSIHGAVLQKTFVLTTSQAGRGYDERRNIYYAGIHDVEEMKSALLRHAGRRRSDDEAFDGDIWKAIAASHLGLYRKALSESAPTGVPRSTGMSDRD